MLNYEITLRRMSAEMRNCENYEMTALANEQVLVSFLDPGE